MEVLITGGLQVPSDRYQGVAAAGLVYRSGVRNVAVVYEDSAYGFGLSFNFIAGFTKGLTPVLSRLSCCA